MGSNKYRPSVLEYLSCLQALPLNLPHERLQLRTNLLTDKLLRRPNIVPCHSAMGQGKTTRSLSICPEQSRWLLGDSERETSRSKAPSNQVVQGMMSSCPVGGFLADKAVNPTGVNHWAAVTLMRDAQIQPEPQANRNSTSSSSNFNPHEAISRANNQSPLCWEEAARKDALLWGEFNEASISALLLLLLLLLLLKMI